jgi:hypothetical protein
MFMRSCVGVHWKIECCSLLSFHTFQRVFRFGLGVENLHPGKFAMQAVGRSEHLHRQVLLNDGKIEGCPGRIVA